MTQLAEQVREYWRCEEVSYRPGVSAEQIAAFEQRWGVVLPDDVRAFFTVVDPVPEYGTCDGEMLTFHALEELENQLMAYGSVPGRPECKYWFIAVDYMLRSWMLAYELLPEPRETCRVIFINGKHEVAFETLAEMLEAYLRDPEEVAFPRRVWPRPNDELGTRN